MEITCPESYFLSTLGKSWFLPLDLDNTLSWRTKTSFISNLLIAQFALQKSVGCKGK